MGRPLKKDDNEPPGCLVTSMRATRAHDAGFNSRRMLHWSALGVVMQKWVANEDSSGASSREDRN